MGGAGGKAAGQPPQASPPSWPTCALVHTCLSVGRGGVTMRQAGQITFKALPLLSWGELWPS